MQKNIKNHATSISFVLGALALVLLALQPAYAAPVVVVPGDGAGYVYYSATAGGAVTPAPVEEGLGNVGMIAAFWKLPLPENWVECNGGAVPAQYPKLIEYLGGVGATMANTPDLRGYFLRSANTGAAGVDAGRAVGSVQGDDIKAHTHTAIVGVFNSGIKYGGIGAPGTYYGSATTSSTGGTETRPHNIAVIYAIKAK